MAKPYKPYRLNVEIIDERLFNFLAELGHGQKTELVVALLELALYHREINNLSFNGLMEAINGYKVNRGD